MTNLNAFSFPSDLTFKIYIPVERPDKSISAEVLLIFLDKTDLLELMNVTPTESEAGDIVQMEEIERDLLDEEDDL